MNIIKASKLAFEYLKFDEEGKVESRQRAVDDVDLDVQAGDFVAILGHNGSGKSTLAKHINAILTPTEGTLYVDGKDTRDESKLWEIRQTAGMVFQNPDNQIIGTIVDEDVGFGPENMGVPQEEIWQRVEQSLKSVGMWEYRSHSPNKLSGGQKQRVAIAGVVAMRPKCIVLDEPTAMLDPNGRKEVIRTVQELNRKEHVTVILITHYMEEVIDADKVIVMDQGRVVMQGTPREVFSHVEELKSYRLDVPQATLVAHELQKKGIGLPDGILSNEELVRELGKLRGIGVPGRTATGVVAGATPADVDAPECTESEAVAGTMSTDAGVSEHTESEAVAGTVSTDAGMSEHTAGESTPPLLRLDHLNYIYSAGTAFERQALTDVNIDIYPGQFIGIIGHTGSGKSTLIQHLNGLVQATSGAVYYNGRNIYDEGYDLKTLRSKVGLVFQYPEHQLFEVDVFTDVCFGPKNLGLPPEEVEARAREALRLVGMKEKYFKKSPFELSGGQKRRVAIAGILAMKPDVLVLDEPTAGLDPKGRDDILDQVAKLHAEQKITVILVSHSMEDIARYVERIIVMNHSRVLYDAPPREVFRHYRKLEAVGLAAPQVTYLVHELAGKGWDVSPDATTVEEAAREIASAL